MANSPNGNLVDLDYLHGRHVELEARVDRNNEDIHGELKTINHKLGVIEKTIMFANGQLQVIGKAVGLRGHQPLPDDWEDITQVNRKDLQRMERDRDQAERDKTRAEVDKEEAEEAKKEAVRKAKVSKLLWSAAIGLLWALKELVTNLASHIQIH